MPRTFRNRVGSCCSISVLLFLAAAAFGAQPDFSRHRLIMLADMGNEPDEEQQNIHLLVCSNEIDIEGLIAVTGKYLRKDPRPDLYFKLIDAYEKVVPNLRLHANGWPSPEYLRSVTMAGQGGYGMDDVGNRSDEGRSQADLGGHQCRLEHAGASLRPD